MINSKWFFSYSFTFTSLMVDLNLGVFLYRFYFICTDNSGGMFMYYSHVGAAQNMARFCTGIWDASLLLRYQRSTVKLLHNFSPCDWVEPFKVLQR